MVQVSIQLRHKAKPAGHPTQAQQWHLSSAWAKVKVTESPLDESAFKPKFMG